MGEILHQIGLAVAVGIVARLTDHSLDRDGDRLVGGEGAVADADGEGEGSRGCWRTRKYSR